MSFMDDCNFSYYDKEKSDVFILGAILLEASLLKSVKFYNKSYIGFGDFILFHSNINYLIYNSKFKYRICNPIWEKNIHQNYMYITIKLPLIELDMSIDDFFSSIVGDNSESIYVCLIN